MAAPSGVTPKDKYVILSLLEGGDIAPASIGGDYMGTVEAIGANVTKTTVGEVVFFKNTNFFRVDVNTWAQCHEDDIYFDYVPL
jgi:NADPH:quinone reductase-like Zn-dependent oxidoreductase